MHPHAFRPRLATLEARDTPAIDGVLTAADLGFFASGATAGGTPLVEVSNPFWFPVARFEAFESGFRGGVRVATGEFDGNPNTLEVVASPGPGGGPRVRVFAVDVKTGEYTVLSDFFAYEPDFRNGVRVAVGKVAGDPDRDQIVLGADPGGGPRVRVLNLDDAGNPVPVRDFFALEPDFRGGVRVAAGEADGNPNNGHEIVVGAGPGGGPRVQVIRTNGSVAADYFALPVSLNNGVNVRVVGERVIADVAVADASQRNASLNQFALAQANAAIAGAAVKAFAAATEARLAQTTGVGLAPVLTGNPAGPAVTFNPPTAGGITFANTPGVPGQNQPANPITFNTPNAGAVTATTPNPSAVAFNTPTAGNLMDGNSEVEGLIAGGPTGTAIGRGTPGIPGI